MVEFATTIRIGKPPHAVASVLLDPVLAPEWTGGLERFEVVEGTPGRPGCVGRAIYLQGSRRHEFIDVLEEVTPNRRYLSRITGPGIEARIETLLEPLGLSDTQVILRWQGRGTNLLTRVSLWLMRRRIRARAGDDLESLRTLVESR